MVGVPRSTGCIPCRQQKKKCTAIANTPPCTRCSRLKISCIGFGERRLKFQDESQKFVTNHSNDEDSSSNKSTTSLHRKRQGGPNQDFTSTTTRISSNPTNILTTLITSFTYSVDEKIGCIQTDTGYHLAWNFGGYLWDVPRYLGFNEALDSAADALVATYDYFLRRSTTVGAGASSGGSDDSVICLRKYSQALLGLRKCLGSVERACEPATLCAVMIIMLLEALLGLPNAAGLQHAGGAAMILKCRGTRPPKDEMERKLLMSLRGPVVIQAFSLEESYYTPTEWKHLVSGFSPPEESTKIEENDEKGFFVGLAATARLFQSTRTVLLSQRDPDLKIQEIERLISSASTLQQKLNEQVSNLSEALSKAREIWIPVIHIQNSNIGIKNKFTHGSCTREYGLALSTQIVLNCILTTLQLQEQRYHNTEDNNNSSDDNYSMISKEIKTKAEKENLRLCNEICDVAERDSIFHRPLGSSWVQMALGVAYIGAYSDLEKESVVRLLIGSAVRDESSGKGGYVGEGGDDGLVERTMKQLEGLAAFLSLGVFGG